MPYILWVWENGDKLTNYTTIKKKIAMYYFPSAMESSICAKIIIVIIIIIIIIIINLGRQNGPFHAGLFCFVE
jgi:hypothetical protein